jgi:DNA-binding beta-propeller fold protein YncE
MLNVKDETILSSKFITDGTDKKIVVPYGIAVNPLTKDVFVTDAGNYVASGMLYCFDKNGAMKWKVQAGDIPAHMAFVY